MPKMKITATRKRSDGTWIWRAEGWTPEGGFYFGQVDHPTKAEALAEVTAYAASRGLEVEPAPRPVAPPRRRY